jgi:phage gpG-like protein
MSDLKITVDTAGLNATFARAGNVGVDIPDALHEIGGALRSATIDRFQTETAPGGVKWKPLAPRTAKRKKSNKILVLRGHLRNSINAQVSGFTLEVGSPLPYAGVHQFGAVIQRDARTQTIKLGVNRRKQEDGTFKKSFGFIKAKRKTGEARDVQVGAHSITIPARPFLDVRLVEDMPRIVEILDREIRHALALPDGGASTSSA